jgi:hypothetical protein
MKAFVLKKVDISKFWKKIQLSRKLISELFGLMEMTRLEMKVIFSKLLLWRIKKISEIPKKI